MEVKKLFSGIKSAGIDAISVALNEELGSTTDVPVIDGKRYYPGIMVKDNKDKVFSTLSPILKKLGLVDYDMKPGTGANFVNAKQGEKIGWHVDFPLYTPEELKDGFDMKSREISFTLVISLVDENRFVTITTVDNSIETKYQLSKGEMLIIPAGLVHMLEEVPENVESEFLCVFCSRDVVSAEPAV